MKCNLRVVLIGLMILSTLGAPISAAQLTPESISMATGWEVLRVYEGGGVVVINGHEVSFEVLQSSELTVDGEQWLASVVRFPALEMTPTMLAHVLVGRECGCSQPPVLIVSNEAGTESYSTVIDKDIVASDHVLALEQGDFMGSGSEISLSLAVHFCDATTREHTTAERRYVFGFPKLEALAALDGHLIIRTPDVVKQARNQISVATSPAGKRGLAYLKQGSPKPVFLNSASPTDVRISKPNGTVATAAIPLSDEQSPSTFRGRVVNERGQPISGIRVEYAAKRSGLWAWLGPVERGSDVTDSEGRFDAPTGDGLTIVIENESFEKLRENFHPAKYNYQLRNMNSKPVKDEVTDLVLIDKNAKVEVWDSGGRIQELVGQRPGSFELGIKFYPSRKENENNPIEVTVLADIVFEFRRLCEPDSPEAKADDCPWEIVIRGQNGWELAPAPEGVDYLAVKSAVDSGYESRWIFTSKALPFTFYLRKDQGQRYGVLGGVRYYKTREDGWNLACSYIVQAEAVGTRSLVHDYRPIAYFPKPRKPESVSVSSP